MISNKLIIIFTLFVFFCATQIVLEDADNSEFISYLQSCAQNSCTQQWDNCNNSQACVQILYECVQSCERNMTCWVICLGEKKNKQAISVGLCGYSNNCLRLTDKKIKKLFVQSQTCFRDLCPNQWQLCLDDQTCLTSIKRCLRKCKTDDDCINNCLPISQTDNPIYCAYQKNCFNGNYESEDQIQDQVQQQVNQEERRQTLTQKSNFTIQNLTGQYLQVKNCAEKKCPKEWKNCVKDQQCLPSILDCLNQCAKNQTCWLTCLPSKGNQLAINGALCAYSNQCLSNIQTTSISQINSKKNPDRVPLTAPISDFPQPLPSPQIADALPNLLKCVQTSCSKEWDKCSKESKCLPAILECANKCNKAEDCWMPCLGGKKSLPAISVAICTYDKKCLQYL